MIKRRINENDFLKTNEVTKIVTVCQLFNFSEEQIRRVLNGKISYKNKVFIYVFINKQDQKEIAVRYNGIYRYVTIENTKETERLIMDFYFNQKYTK